MTLFIVE